MEIVGHVIGQLSAVGSWIRDQRVDGSRCFVIADVPEENVGRFAAWLAELDPKAVSTNLGSTRKDGDV